MDIQLYDEVKITVDYRKVKKGSVGVVTAVYDGGKQCTVEFNNKKGDQVDRFTIKSEYLQKI